MVQPRFPGVGTQSRIADVQGQQSAFNFREEEGKRQSGLALLGLLANTGIDIGQLVQRSRQAAKQREFETGERQGAEAFRGTQLEAGRGLDRDIAEARESGLATRGAAQLGLGQERLESEEARAGDLRAQQESQFERRLEFDTDIEQERTTRRAAEIAAELKREELQLGRLSQQSFDAAVQNLIGQLAVDVSTGDVAREDAQAFADEALMTLGRPFPNEAANNDAVRQALERSARAGEIRERQAQRLPPLGMFEPFSPEVRRMTDAERAARRRGIREDVERTRPDLLRISGPGK